MNAGNGGSVAATLDPTLAAGTHNISAKYSGDAKWTAAASSAVTIVATTPDFNVADTPHPLAVTAGQTATITLSSQSILGYSNAVAISFGPLPVGISCNTANLQPSASGTIILMATAPGTIAASTSAHG